MKRFSKSMLGVTLLEIMLVLAIAAMIIVMSIRYYQSATSSAQSNQAMQEVQAVMAAMDNLGLAGGYTAASQASLSATVGSTNMVTPSGGAITLGTTATNTYSVTASLNTTVCPSVAAKLQGNTKITAATCDSSGTLTMSYDRTK